MKNKIVLTMLLSSIFIFRSNAMEGENTVLSDSIHEKFAQFAIQIHSTLGFKGMAKLINSRSNLTDQFFNFNKTCKDIAQAEGSFNIFANEALRIYRKGTALEFGEFFKQFCNKLKLNIITTIIENETNFESISKEDIDALCDIILTITNSLDDISFTSKLSQRLKLQKNELMIDYFTQNTKLRSEFRAEKKALKQKAKLELKFKANSIERENFLELKSKLKDNYLKQNRTFNEVVNCPLFMTLRKLCVLINDVILEKTSKIEIGYIDDVPNLPKDLKSIFDNIFLVSPECGPINKQIEPDVRSLAHEDRAILLRYLFFSFLPLNNDYIVGRQLLNKRISWICHNHLIPIRYLGYKNLTQRISFLNSVLNFGNKVWPEIFELCRNAIVSNQLGPKGKSVHYLMSHLTDCIAIKILDDLVQSKFDFNQAKKNLKFVADELGDNFFKSMLFFIEKHLKVLFKVMVVEKDRNKKSARELIKRLKKAIYLLNEEQPLSNSVLKFSSKVWANLEDFVE